MRTKPRPENSVWGPVRSVAGVWVTYGVVETAFAGVVPWAIHSRAQYVPLNAVFSAFVFALYGAVGVVLGLLLGSVWALARRRTRAPHLDHDAELWSAVGVLTVLVASLVNAVAQHAAVYVVWPLLLALALTTARFRGAWRTGAGTSLGWATTPSVVFVLLLTGFYVGEERTGMWVGITRVAGVSICMLVVLSLAFLASRVRLRLGALRIRAGRSLAVAVAGLLVAIVILGEHPRPVVALASAAHRHSTGVNVLLITLDSVRADHLSVYGYGRNTTPYLQRFVSSDATLYTHAVAAADMTLSSHASIFTGLVPRRHGTYCLPNSYCGALSPDIPTLATLLGQSGYETSAVVANTVFLNHEFAMDRGFRHFDLVLHVQPATRSKDYYVRQSVAAVIRRAGVSEDNTRQYSRGDAVTDRALAAISRAVSDGRPFFGFVNYMDAHSPYVPSEPFASMYPGRDPGFDWDRYPVTVEQLLAGRGRMDARMRAHLVSQYDGGIAYLDSQLATLFNALRRLDVYDDTLIIVTSDHGEAFGERNLLGHGHGVYQDEIAVPLIVKYPGAHRGGVSSVVVGGVDILPTTLDVAGLPVPAGIDGRTVLHAKGRESPPLISESFGAPNIRGSRVQRSVLLWPFKLIASRARLELYNVADDPDETRDLSLTEPDVERQLEAVLTQYAARPGASLLPVPVSARGLGYLQ